jgi:hypothetical protein
MMPVQSILSSTDCTDHTIKYGLHSPHYQVQTAQITLSNMDCTVHTNKYGLHSPHYQVRTAQSTLTSTDCTVHTIQSKLHHPQPILTPPPKPTHTESALGRHGLRGFKTGHSHTVLINTRGLLRPTNLLT